MALLTQTVKIAITSFAVGAAMVGSVAMVGYNMADQNRKLAQEAQAATPATELSAPESTVARDDVGIRHMSTLYRLDDTKVMMYTIGNRLESITVNDNGTLIEIKHSRGGFEIKKYATGR